MKGVIIFLLLIISVSGFSLEIFDGTGPQDWQQTDSWPLLVASGGSFIFSCAFFVLEEPEKGWISLGIGLLTTGTYFLLETING